MIYLFLITSHEIRDHKRLQFDIPPALFEHH